MASHKKTQLLIQIAEIELALMNIQIHSKTLNEDIYILNQNLQKYFSRKMQALKGLREEIYSL